MGFPHLLRGGILTWGAVRTGSRCDIRRFYGKETSPGGLLVAAAQRVLGAVDGVHVLQVRHPPLLREGILTWGYWWLVAGG